MTNNQTRPRRDRPINLELLAEATPAELIEWGTKWRTAALALEVAARELCEAADRSLRQNARREPIGDTNMRAMKSKTAALRRVMGE